MSSAIATHLVQSMSQRIARSRREQCDRSRSSRLSRSRGGWVVDQPSPPNKRAINTAICNISSSKGIALIALDGDIHSPISGNSRLHRFFALRPFPCGHTSIRSLAGSSVDEFGRSGLRSAAEQFDRIVQISLP